MLENSIAALQNIPQGGIYWRVASPHPTDP